MDTENKPNNQPAFPNTDGVSFCNDGMTLRDYFANSAMQGIVSSDQGCSYYNAEHLAIKSYEIADEMLKQREL